MIVYRQSQAPETAPKNAQTRNVHLLSYRRAIESHPTPVAKLCLVLLHLDGGGDFLLQPGHSSEVSFARADSLATLFDFVDGGSLPLGAAHAFCPLAWSSVSH